MLSDIVGELIGQSPDLILGATISTDDRLVEEALDAGADVVVLSGHGESMPRDAERLFELLPEVRLITIDNDGTEAFLYRLEPTVRPLGELSPPGLVAAIRSAARAHWSGVALVRGDA